MPRETNLRSEHEKHNQQAEGKPEADRPWLQNGRSDALSRCSNPSSSFRALGVGIPFRVFRGGGSKPRKAPTSRLLTVTVLREAPTKEVLDCPLRHATAMDAVGHHRDERVLRIQRQRLATTPAGDVHSAGGAGRKKLILEGRRFPEFTSEGKRPCSQSWRKTKCAWSES